MSRYTLDIALTVNLSVHFATQDPIKQLLLEEGPKIYLPTYLVDVKLLSILGSVSLLSGSPNPKPHNPCRVSSEA